MIDGIMEMANLPVRWRPTPNQNTF